MGPDRDSFATWPVYRFAVLCKLNECITACLPGVFVYVRVCICVCGRAFKLMEFISLAENK